MRYETINKSVILVISVFAIIQLFNSVLILGPNQDTLNRKPEFSWYGNHDKYRLVVDNDPEFENPVVDILTNERNYLVQENLDLGEYYWKVIGYKNNEETNSLTGRFVVMSYVGYSLENNELTNVGNVISKLTGPTGYVVLDINDNHELIEGEYNIQQNE